MFRVKATGDDLHFLWQKDCEILCDGGRYRDTGTDTLRIIEVEKNDNKSRYRCLVRNDKGEKLSQEAVLTVSKLVIMWLMHMYFWLLSIVIFPLMYVVDTEIFISFSLMYMHAYLWSSMSSPN